jgi:hypothetical protein
MDILLIIGYQRGYHSQQGLYTSIRKTAGGRPAVVFGKIGGRNRDNSFNTGMKTDNGYAAKALLNSHPHQW